MPSVFGTYGSVFRYQNVGALLRRTQYVVNRKAAPLPGWKIAEAFLPAAHGPAAARYEAARSHPVHPEGQAAKGAADVLPDRHIGKERILLEQIPVPALLRRQIDVLFAVRALDARDALERPALAATGQWIFLTLLCFDAKLTLKGGAICLLAVAKAMDCPPRSVIAHKTGQQNDRNRNEVPYELSSSCDYRQQPWKSGKAH